ncbi:MAG: sensor histidine kinase [Lachnospiraceae bacterium]|nr:sensor histidine kinase [Lachnospiraceae bacterium]
MKTRIQNIFENMEFKQKILVMFIAASMLLSILLSFGFYNRSAETIQENYRKSMENSLTALTKSFDSIMRDAYSAGVYAASDQTIQDLMTETESFQDLEEELIRYKNLNSAIQSVYCYLDDADVLVKLGSEGAQITENTEAVTGWMEEIRSMQADRPLTPVFLKDSTSLIQHNYFTFEQDVIDDSGETIGFIFVNVDERDIWFQSLQNSVGDGIDSYIVLGEHNLVASAEQTNLLNTSLVISEDSFTVTADMSMSDYRIISVSDKAAMLSDIKSARNYILAFALLLNFFFCVPIYSMVRRLMQPINDLEETMEHLKEGDLSARAEVYHHDEIGRLTENFNDMLAKMEELIDELVKERMLKKEAEIEALQYQITPHFMYNTLASIKYAAMIGRGEKVPELLQAFTELLRISASDRGSFITVEQEVHMVENYVRLQRFRYDNSFAVSFAVESQTENFYVPRLLIQPLVENAILHGLDHKQKDNRIHVDIRQKERNLEIRVMDNGSGMTEEEIVDLLNGTKRTKFSGIGINNIKERLKLYYGDKGELRYESSPGEGTEAVIILPVSDNPDRYTI